MNHLNSSEKLGDSRDVAKSGASTETARGRLLLPLSIFFLCEFIFVYFPRKGFNQDCNLFGATEPNTDRDN